MCDACGLDHGPHFHPDTSIGIFLCCASGLAAVAERIGQIGWDEELVRSWVTLAEATIGVTRWVDHAEAMVNAEPSQ